VRIVSRSPRFADRNQGVLRESAQSAERAIVVAVIRAEIPWSRSGPSEGDLLLLDGVNHVALITDDTERFVRFYQEVFDAKVSHREQIGPGTLTMIDLSSDCSCGGTCRGCRRRRADVVATRVLPPP
jgi:Glyoxalase/Bleomycin resistance protein/Dioxygenase superfamily